jgi:hypothetical protein
MPGQFQFQPSSHLSSTAFEKPASGLPDDRLRLGFDDETIAVLAELRQASGMVEREPNARDGGSMGIAQRSVTTNAYNFKTHVLSLHGQPYGAWSCKTQRTASH